MVLFDAVAELPAKLPQRICFVQKIE